jgi:hypothetical protein
MGKQQPVVEPKPVEVVPEPVVPIEIAAPAATRTKTLDTKKKRR